MFSSKSFVDRYVELVFMNHDKALAVKSLRNGFCPILERLVE